MNTISQTSIPANPFFAVLKASTTPSSPHLYQVHRESAAGNSEWIANGASMTHAAALSERMNLHFQQMINDYIRTTQRHSHLVPSKDAPTYIVREEDDLPMATRQMRWTQTPGPLDTVLYIITDPGALNAFAPDTPAPQARLSPQPSAIPA